METYITDHNDADTIDLCMSTRYFSRSTEPEIRKVFSRVKNQSAYWRIVSEPQQIGPRWWSFSAKQVGV